MVETAAPSAGIAAANPATPVTYDTEAWACMI